VEYLQNFDITNQINILRLICGLFFVPHIYAKFFVPEALGFFVASGLKPPKVWLYVACVIETIVAVGLIFAIFPFFAALLGCLHLLVALYLCLESNKG
jgi:putative oxidoreductase